MQADLQERVNRATSPFEAKLDALGGKIDSTREVLSAKIEANAQVLSYRSSLTRWIIGTAIAALAIGYSFLKATGHLV